MGCARDRKGECIIVFNDSCGTEDEMNSQLFSRELHKEIAQDVTYKEAEYSYISVDTQQDCSKDMKKLLWFLQHDDEWFGIDADDTLMCTFEKWQENKNYLFKAIKRNDKEDDENYVPERIRWISKKKILGYGTSGAVEECAIEEIHGEGILHHETKITETSSAIQPSEISTVFTSKSPCFPCCVARKKFYHERTGDYLKEKTVLMNICTFIRSATSQSVEGEHKLSQMVLSLPFLSLVGFNDAERVLATFPVGSPVRVPFSRAAYRSLPDIVFQLKMLHQIGYVHGDVRPGNWIEVPGKDFTNREGEEELSSKNDILIESESVDNPVRLILIDYAMCSELSTDIATKPFPSDYVPKHHKSCFTRFGGSLGYASDSILRQMTSGSLESEIVFCAGDDLCAFVKSVLMARETNEERKMFDEIRMQVTRKAIKEGKKNVTLNDLAEGYRDYWEKKTISEFWLKMLSEAENEDYEAIIEDLNTLSKQEDECVS
ncbi:uncharacterized protein MONOS_9850 [Monocercomonoides exilis]|uniref:uncharacterized protein n=1 Tax=Monocercomonoides exilis TaxID=2049356 RepID=UPI0035596ECA|nr:hypothetical protein MONOS_9850 [Monocercomonoides exilis]|eukprot:MONOS_9850.1-p1 / transcript=MONOS_9850.1 / gene=MONOS_9850 / organism=Monocercomonoides_exilis_PA203 / gene_product=unspecified product / transcript_product=unspecified product / location=Mono_scaffold00422:37880-39349(+) / protein_length=490 / sequence_SO=supercontig / SO=protein_coding / is_pseudo=false